MTPIDVRSVPPDGELATRLLQRYYQELGSRWPGGFDIDETEGDLIREMGGPRGSFLVAYMDGCAVGCGGIRKLDTRTAEIKRMWIDPDVRRRGVGGRLLAALEDGARELDCERVCLDTKAELGEALTLYRSRGYIDIPAYNNNPYATHWLQKQLA